MNRMSHSELYDFFQIHTNQTSCNEIIALFIFEYLMGKLHALAFCFICTYVVFSRSLFLTCKNTSLFSVLHLAVYHGCEQLVDQVLQLMEQMQAATQSVIDSKGYSEKVSDL